MLLATAGAHDQQFTSTSSDERGPAVVSVRLQADRFDLEDRQPRSGVCSAARFGVADKEPRSCCRQNRSALYPRCHGTLALRAVIVRYSRSTESGAAASPENDESDQSPDRPATVCEGGGFKVIRFFLSFGAQRSNIDSWHVAFTNKQGW